MAQDHFIDQTLKEVEVDQLSYETFVDMRIEGPHNTPQIVANKIHQILFPDSPNPPNRYDTIEFVIGARRFWPAFHNVIENRMYSLTPEQLKEWAKKYRCRCPYRAAKKAFGIDRDIAEIVIP